MTVTLCTSRFGPESHTKHSSFCTEHHLQWYPRSHERAMNIVVSHTTFPGGIWEKEQQQEWEWTPYVSTSGYVLCKLCTEKHLPCWSGLPRSVIFFPPPHLHMFSHMGQQVSSVEDSIFGQHRSAPRLVLRFNFHMAGFVVLWTNIRLQLTSSSAPFVSLLIQNPSRLVLWWKKSFAPQLDFFTQPQGA